MGITEMTNVVSRKLRKPSQMVAGAASSSTALLNMASSSSGERYCNGMGQIAAALRASAAITHVTHLIMASEGARLLLLRNLQYLCCDAVNTTTEWYFQQGPPPRRPK